jgi:RNA polymerase sigma-70 factor (ECF subfamily)
LSRNTGLKNDEIAARLGTTKRNVESQLSLALRDIRRAVMTVFILFP